MAFLQVENLCKSFGSAQILKDITFSLEKGEVLAIIGTSGNGKTTLLRCLNFLETPDSGTVTVGEETVFDGSEGRIPESVLRKRRLNFGLVFQSFNLFSQYNVLENAKLAKLLLIKEEAKTKGKDKTAYLKSEREACDREARRLLCEVGLGEKLDFYPCELSGGQCQRVAIVRALMLSPAILCFDEPTSALDPLLTGEVLRVIRNLKDSERTMIIVTHEMEFARGVADRIIFMDEGRIEEEGTPEEIFGNPKNEKTKAFLAGYRQ